MYKTVWLREWLYSSLLFCTALYCSVLYCAVLNSIVLLLYMRKSSSTNVSPFTVFPTKLAFSQVPTEYRHTYIYLMYILHVCPMKYEALVIIWSKIQYEVVRLDSWKVLIVGCGLLVVVGGITSGWWFLVVLGGSCWFLVVVVVVLVAVAVAVPVVVGGLCSRCCCICSRTPPSARVNVGFSCSNTATTVEKMFFIVSSMSFCLRNWLYSNGAVEISKTLI